ncbi:MAG: hypothetical protein ACM33B_14260 [Pseudomonadota bacterium]
MDRKSPAEKAGELADEAGRGRSERTPWLALGGVGTVIAVAVGVLALVVLLVYWVA